MIQCVCLAASMTIIFVGKEGAFVGHKITVTPSFSTKCMCQSIQVSGYVSGTEFASLSVCFCWIFIVWYFFIFHFILDIINHQTTRQHLPDQLIRL